MGTAAVPGRFVAIDFETADYGRDSACALAVVVVDGLDVVEQRYALIRPPRSHIHFSYLHKITWAHVADKPVFGETWPTLLPLFEGAEFVAAHNASFDKGVLAECCRRSGHPPLALPFRCTVALARKTWGIRPANLPSVCRHLGIPLDHHHAASDALACAKIVIAARVTPTARSPQWR
ncbi:MAG TPA: exonuclease domain-containing protein [Fimbriiglobus sp.]|jgi:DNA polymerase-3 subunit epsilon